MPGVSVPASTTHVCARAESNWFLLKLLREGPLAARLSGCRVVDLGSGPGLAGIAAAASGAHVLLTDLPSVVDELLSRNVTRNARSAGSSGTANYEAPAACYTSATAIEGSWAGAQRIGLGSAATMPLDWTASIHQQAASNPNDPRHADYILAADTIWLKDIFHSFVHTVVELLRSGAKACLLAFVERAAEGSKLFVHREAVTEAFELAGCSVDVVHTQDVLIDGVPKPGQVLEIRLCDAAST